MAQQGYKNSRNLQRIVLKNETAIFKIVKNDTITPEQFDEICKYIGSVFLLNKYHCITSPGFNESNSDTIKTRYIISFDKSNRGTIQTLANELATRLENEFSENDIPIEGLLYFDIFYGNYRENSDARLEKLGGKNFGNQFKDISFSTFDEYERLSKMVINSIYKNGWKLK